MVAMLHVVLIYYILTSESLCVEDSLQSSKTLRNRTPYQNQYGSILWAALGKKTLRR